MSDDWNIRAAKALGWDWDDHFDCIDHIPEEHKVFVHDYYDGSLHFTTSFDWAMLGVKALPGDKISNYLFTLVEQLIMNVDLESFKTMSDVVIQAIILQATPAQITQAWVEVLEGVKDEH